MERELVQSPTLTLILIVLAKCCRKWRVQRYTATFGNISLDTSKLSLMKAGLKMA